MQTVLLLALVPLFLGLGCPASPATPTSPAATPTATRLVSTATPFPTPTPTAFPTAILTPSGPRVILGGVAFSVELAVTPEERARGLMGREELGGNEGMLFLYESDGTPGFWMLGMLIPLDIVWIDREGVVVGVERNVPPAPGNPQPLLYFPPRPIRYVLEIQAERAEEADIGAGSRATFVGIPLLGGS